MTVGELIERLQDFADDTPVEFVLVQRHGDMVYSISEMTHSKSTVYLLTGREQGYYHEGTP